MANYFAKVTIISSYFNEILDLQVLLIQGKTLPGLYQYAFIRLSQHLSIEDFFSYLFYIFLTCVLRPDVQTSGMCFFRFVLICFFQMLKVMKKFKGNFFQGIFYFLFQVFSVVYRQKPSTTPVQCKEEESLRQAEKHTRTHIENVVTCLCYNLWSQMLTST